MDVAGDNQLNIGIYLSIYLSINNFYMYLNIEHEMIKFRLSSSGSIIGVPGAEIIGELDPPVPVIPTDYCGSCYGAELVLLSIVIYLFSYLLIGLFIGLFI
jgi:hypothetical protein